MQEKGYKLWADVVRVLATYFVVIIHTTSFSTPSASLFQYISFAISKTAIPLFLMLTGALLLSKKESLTVFYKKRFARIILPWVTWSTVYFFVLSLNTPSFSFTLPHILKGIETTMLGYWYVPMILCIYVLIPFLRIFIQAAKTRDILILCILWFFALSVLPFFHNTQAFPLSSENSLVKQVCMYMGYVLIGYICTKIPLKKTFRKNASGLFVVGFITTLLLTALATTNTINLTYYDYISPSIVITSTGLFALLFHLFRNKHVPDKVHIFLRSLSAVTYGIFLLHVIMIKLISIYLPELYLSFPNELILGLIYFLFSYVILAILTKIPSIKPALT